jgi:hypothetical protein
MGMGWCAMAPTLSLELEHILRGGLHSWFIKVVL